MRLGWKLAGITHRRPARFRNLLNRAARECVPRAQPPPPAPSHSSRVRRRGIPERLDIVYARKQSRHSAEYTVHQPIVQLDINNRVTSKKPRGGRRTSAAAALFAQIISARPIGARSKTRRRKKGRKKRPDAAGGIMPRQRSVPQKLRN